MTKNSYSHLSSSAQEALNLPIKERIEYLKKSRWIGYTQAKIILDKMEDLLFFPPRHRMPNLLIVGETNNGKTMIVKRFLNLHPADDNPEGENARIPVLYIQAPPIPDEGRFYNTILDKLFAPYKMSDRVDKRQTQAIHLLQRVGLRILIIDEIHHILAGNLNKQRQFLNVLKYLGNELMVPIVAVGTQDAFRAIQTEPQLANRFEPAILPKWAMDTEYLQLLASFERIIPLKKLSNLTQPDLARKLLVMSEGTIGELSSLLIAVTKEAIESGKECIDINILEKTRWISPSERRKTAELKLKC